MTSPLGVGMGSRQAGGWRELHLRRCRPGRALQYYTIAGTRSVRAAQRHWLAPWPLWWACLWQLDLGDDRALPDPGTDCVVRLLSRYGPAHLPDELWLWRDKYWRDVGCWFND